MKPVSIVTVTYNGLFFTRLLVEKVRELAGRPYEIIAVDRGSKDGTRDWLRQQPDVTLLGHRQWTRRHNHGEAAEAGVRAARHEAVVLLDSDAHPVSTDWLEQSVDRLDDHHRLAGAVFCDRHAGNPHGWYIHPHFMAFLKEDLESLIILRKMRGHDTDTGEEATIRVLEAGKGIIRFPIERSEAFSVGHPRVPTVAGGVFHAWYVTRLFMKPESVARETAGVVTPETYLLPLQQLLRKTYGLDY